MVAMTVLARDLPFTRDDLDAMPDDGHRYELLDGMLLVTPAPRFSHQSTVGALYLALSRACPTGRTILFAPFDVVLSDDTVLQPDLLVAPTDSFTERDLPTAPLLAVEVLSPSTKSFDRVLKRERYQRAGVASYWIVDCEERTLVALELVDGEYVVSATLTSQDIWSTTKPFAVTISLAEVFA